MVIVDFLPDPGEIADATQDELSDLRTEHPGTVALTNFKMPVRLNVGGVELFDFPEAPESPYGLRVWLLDFAASGRSAVKLAWATGSASFDFVGGGWELRFERQDKSICVCLVPLRLPERCGCAPYTEFRREWDDFERRVRTYLSREVPDLLENPYWGAWLRGAEVEEIPLP